MPVSKVIVYTREHCHLCEDMLDHLRSALLPELHFELETRDIDSDSEWRKRYNHRVPVLLVNGQELCDYYVDEVKFRKALAR